MPRGIPKTPRVRTAKQLANDQRMREEAARGREALQEAREAQMVEREDDGEYVSAADLFGTAANLFSKAATEGRLTRSETVQLEEILGKIDPLKNPEIADNPAVAAFIEQMVNRKQDSQDIEPGSLVGTGLAAIKKPWTHQEVMRRYLDCINGKSTDKAFMPVTFIPFETKPIIWNGLKIGVAAGEQCTAPACFFEVYNNSLTAKKSAQLHAEILFRSRDRMNPGETSVDVTIMGNDATARVRGAGQGTYFPGEGGFDPGTEEGAA